MTEIEFTALFPFCGLGAGARGFVDAEVQLLGRRAKFRSLGGIDSDAEGCADFERLTGSPAWCTDIATVTAAQLVQRYGRRAPDVVFMSPPCKGSSGLLSAKKAKSAKYRKMNGLALTWTRRMLEAWPDPPGLVLLENVPRITTRAKSMLKKLRAMLRKAGYLFADGYHDCGELGGLAQHRRRYLLVARHPRKVPPLLYQPPKRRVRGCGEVLGQLPMPEDPVAGPMHRLPRISWLNWVRLALIPAGGDWRDLPGVLEEGEPRRAKWGRHGVAAWEAPTKAVTGSGSNGVTAVADPRLTCEPRAGAYGVSAWADPASSVIGSQRIDNARAAVADPRFGNVDRVKSWDAPAGTITSSPAPSSGAGAVADPRPFALPSCKPGRHNNKYRVKGWEDPAGTVIGATRPGSGAPCVADPRPRRWFKGALGVRAWDDPMGAVCGETWPQNGRFSIADPRVRTAFDAGYAVLSWDQAARTIAGKSAVGCGAYSVADPRVEDLIPGLRPVTDEELAIAAAAPKKAPPFLPVILAQDGTWHRPMTTLELAALQGLPVQLDGEVLVLAGGAVSRWRERIGNAVPCPTARAIAERMLVALTEGAMDTFSLSSGDVWVEPERIDAEVNAEGARP